MEIALWIVQILMGFAFLMAGIMKSTQPKDKLFERMEWVEDFSPNIIKVIGVLEILGGLGLILPHRLNILPFLTPLAATGLVLTMIGAAVVHLRRNEIPTIAVNIVLGGLVGFVLWQTFALLPF